ncbi:unnamed protein product [Caenorhabditis auriculariae]|uniref:BPTI/Kunitz inhibitor domain-containing protein n=1 Tax=Caenorhabditis auriculariae TaxID=2777116 RepID=A0A8S1HC69_9PELO|nr:unnamed protein product [Caenorhabditis auriculariae]
MAGYQQQPISGFTGHIPGAKWQVGSRPPQPSPSQQPRDDVPNNPRTSRPKENPTTEAQDDEGPQDFSEMTNEELRESLQQMQLGMQKLRRALSGNLHGEIEKDPFEGIEAGWWSKGEVQRNKERREIANRGRAVAGGDWQQLPPSPVSNRRRYQAQREMDEDDIPTAGYSGHIQGMRQLGIGKPFNVAAKQAKQEYIERRKAYNRSHGCRLSGNGRKCVINGGFRPGVMPDGGDPRSEIGVAGPISLTVVCRGRRLMHALRPLVFLLEGRLFEFVYPTHRFGKRRLLRSKQSAQTMRLFIPRWSILLPAVFLTVKASLECDPTSNVKKIDPSNPESYLYCNLEGSFSKRKCLGGKVFNAETSECELLRQSDSPVDNFDDIFSQPFYQAPDDLCGSGIPLTILSAPVVCNPSISSCPDGYVCRLYERTGTSYCCQNPSPTSGSTSRSNDRITCGEGRTTFIELSSGKPRSCVLSNAASCPTGFACTLVSGSTTRCCAKDLGCPANSAPQLRPNTASHVECSSQMQCQQGFSCLKSTYLNKNICCSENDGESNGTCPNGEEALGGTTCSASKSCPTGFVCNNEKCCPSTGSCPVGSPLGGGPMTCSEKSPCSEGYTCITTNGAQFCCPSKEKVCIQSKNAGVSCASNRPSVTRYHFDRATGTCRSFKYSQCGGNANNFHSLEECEGFCVDTQCPNGQAFRVGAVNAACALSSLDTCPKQHFCQQPLFGPSPICCPTPEQTCNEMVSAGTPCFGRSLTFQRFYFNPSTQKCQPFQYYGCNGNGNNFESAEQCKSFCLHAVDSVCGGQAPLMNPNQELQKCSTNIPCPNGYECNDASFCCPTSATACSAVLSKGNSCKGSTQRSMWYYDKSTQKCSQFVYNGCGGTPNRFYSKGACTDACVQANLLGSCPRGMSPFIDNGETTPKACTLNVRGTCPNQASCVRSTTNQPICCQTVTACPQNRTPYLIPGSNSVVSCNSEGNDCPDNYSCLESSTAPGFHMCCSSISSQRPTRPRNSNIRKPYEPDTLAELIENVSPCPPHLVSNGQTCTVNAPGDCPSSHVCFRDVGYEYGSCCRTTPPKCALKGYVPVFIEKTQVQICQVDIGGCPKDSRCMTSNVAKLSICCKVYTPPQPAINRPNKAGAVSNRQAICANGERAFTTPDNKLQECNFVHNTCPTGYQCEFSSTGQAVCCMNANSIRCPAGSSVFEFGGRPLACPPGSNKCPAGYACLPSQNPQHHLCCSTGIAVTSQPQCARGVAFVNPATNQRQFCNPHASDCPAGYHCFESDSPTQFICCTHGDLNDRFRGYCPPRQVPYVSRDGFPPTCHMQLNPCPTTAPYICIYSPEKQDSYCCAPIDTAVRSYIPDRASASPMKKIGTGADYGEHLGLPEAPISNVPGMTQTFPGGPAAPGMGPVAIPDPIPGVDSKLILPPGLANSQLNNQPTIENKNQPSGNLFENNGNSGPKLSGLPVGVVTQVGGFTGFGEQSGGSGGCPLGSRPLMGMDRQVAECSQQPCPEGFSCVFAEKENRFQCCSSSSIMLAMGRPTGEATPTPTLANNLECPPGFFMIDGKCLKVLFAGQKGCVSDDQCSNREPNATCDSGYCICPTGKPLVHGGRCVATCPEGFANIAGRCYDPTTVIFMDSVDERSNGTIGGYCLDTLIEEKRCNVEHSYCSEKTITCQCMPGFDLDMDFDNKNDKGNCKKNSNSKFLNSELGTPPPADDELYFIDISSMGTDSTGNETEKANEDLTRYLFQADEMVPVFA